MMVFSNHSIVIRLSQRVRTLLLSQDVSSEKLQANALTCQSHHSFAKASSIPVRLLCQEQDIEAGA